MDIIFRKATKRDVKGIVELCNDCFGDRTNLETAQEIFNKTKDDPNVIYLIGEHNGKIITHTRINIIETIFRNMETYAIVNHVCVRGDYRRHKIATKMLDEIVKICKERNCISIKLWSNNFRKAAHACYKNYGFIANDAVFFTLDI